MTDMTQPDDSKKYGRDDNERVINFMKIAKPAAIPIIPEIMIVIMSMFV